MTEARAHQRAYVVTQRFMSTTFYLTIDLLPTDILERAGQHSEPGAQWIARNENRNPAWSPAMQKWTVREFKPACYEAGERQE